MIHRYSSRWYKPNEAATVKDLLNLLVKLKAFQYYRLTEYRSMTSSPTGRTWQLEIHFTTRPR